MYQLHVLSINMDAYIPYPLLPLFQGIKDLRTSIFRVSSKNYWRHGLDIVSRNSEKKKTEERKYTSCGHRRKEFFDSNSIQ